MAEVRQKSDFQKIIVKLQDKLYQNTIKLKQINSELNQLKLKNQELIDELDNSNDLNEKLIIEKELRDNEYLELKNKYLKLQTDYDVIHNELSREAKCEDLVSANDEYFEEKELELNLRIEELIEELEEYKEYKTRFEEVNLQLVKSYDLIENLKEQQENNINYIKIIEDLTDKNLKLNSDVKNLKKNVSELEDLTIISNDLENFHKMSINELNLEIQNQVATIHGLEVKISNYIKNEAHYEKLISNLKFKIKKLENGNIEDNENDNGFAETSIIVDGSDEIVLLKEEIESLEKEKVFLSKDKDYLKFQLNNANKFMNELQLFINKSDFQNILKVIKFDNFLNLMIFKLKDSNIFENEDAILDNNLRMQVNFLVEFFKLLKYRVQYCFKDIISDQLDSFSNEFFEMLTRVDPLSKVEEILCVIFSYFNIDDEENNNSDILKLHSLIDKILMSWKYFHFKNLQIYKLSQIIKDDYQSVKDIHYELENPNDLIKKSNNNNDDFENNDGKSLAEMFLQNYKFLNKKDFDDLNITIIEKNKLINQLNLKINIINEKLTKFNENLQTIKDLRIEISNFKKTNLQLNKKLNESELSKSQKISYKEDIKILQKSYLFDKLNTYQNIISQLTLSSSNIRNIGLESSKYDWLIHDKKMDNIHSLRNYNIVKINLIDKLLNLCHNVKILQFEDSIDDKNNIKFKCMKNGSYIARMNEDLAIYKEIKRKIVNQQVKNV